MDGVDSLEERDVFGRLRGVHAVHCGYCVFAVYRGQGRSLGDYLSYEGFADAESGGYVAVGFAFFDEFEDVVLHRVVVMFAWFAEVAVFGCEFFEYEVDIAVSLDYFIDHYIVGSVAEFSCPDFELFDVAQAFVFGGFAYGEYGVEEVVELLGACEVVLGDGT